jgi:hypothetical protein
MMQTRPALKIPQKLLENCRILEGRDALLHFLPEQQTIVEIGVGLGDFSRKFLEYCKPRRFIAIDNFKLHELPEFWGKSPREWFGNKTHLEFFKNKFSSAIEKDQLSILEGDSPEQIKKLNDKTVDVFYVDGDHTYEGVCRDLNQIKDKISDDGIIILNDYIMRDDNGPYGVVQATNEFMISHDWEMIFFCLQTSMYCDVAIRKRSTDKTFKSFMEIQSENKRLLEDISIIKNSTSWRMSSVIRLLGGIFRRRPQNLLRDKS